MSRSNGHSDYNESLLGNGYDGYPEAHSAINSTSDDHVPLKQKDLILDAGKIDANISLAGLTMAAGAIEGEYVSLQRARELSSLKLCGFVPLKGLLLMCICFLTFGSYWVFDSPGALYNQLTAWFGPENYTDSSGALLYTVYSLPNTVLPFFSGIIIDRFLGVRRSALLFSLLIFVGDAIFFFGIASKTFWLAVLGRLVFGLGGESLTVAQNAFTVRWFDGKQLALAFGLVLAFARCGTSFNFIISPVLADDGMKIALAFGLGTCLLSFGFTLIAAGADAKGVALLEEERNQMLINCTPEQKKYIREQDIAHEPKQDAISMKDFKLIPLDAWLMCLVCLFFYVAVLTFYTVAQDIITNTGNKYSAATADVFISIPSFVSIAASPFFGGVVDRVGRSLWFIIAASIMLAVGHGFFLLFAFDIAVGMTPIPVMIWIGVSYAMGAAAMWPILAVMVPSSVLGTAYGAMTAIQNCGLAAFPQIISALRRIDGIQGTNYEYVISIIVFIACVSIACGITLLILARDARAGGRFNASAGEREATKLLLESETAAAAASAQSDDE